MSETIKEAVDLIPSLATCEYCGAVPDHGDVLLCRACQEFWSTKFNRERYREDA